MQIQTVGGLSRGSKKDGFSESFPFPELKIYDRVGGGDGFASGFIYGLLENMDFDTALKFGIAHGALAMTTPGDIYGFS